MHFNPRSIIGKRVVRVEMNAYRAGSGFGARVMHQPEIYFEDGSSIAFNTEEHPEGAEYGTDIIYRKD